ncbi:MAG: hypothetical protein AAFQ60_15795 [Pseudomonadota bacterium]
MKALMIPILFALVAVTFAASEVNSAYITVAQNCVPQGARLARGQVYCPDGAVQPAQPTRGTLGARFENDLGLRLSEGVYENACRGFGIEILGVTEGSPGYFTGLRRGMKICEGSRRVDDLGKFVFRAIDRGDTYVVNVADLENGGRIIQKLLVGPGQSILAQMYRAGVNFRQVQHFMVMSPKWQAIQHGIVLNDSDIERASLIIEFVEASSQWGNADCRRGFDISSRVNQTSVTVYRDVWSGVGYASAPSQRAWTLHYHPGFRATLEAFYGSHRVGGLAYGNDIRRLMGSVGCNSEAFRHMEAMLLDLAPL